MWDRIEALLERAPGEDALRLHRVQLLEGRRRRQAGLDGASLAADENLAMASHLALVPLLTRVREAWDGPLVVMKGPELGLDYPAPWLRPLRDLDLLTDDAERAQAALIAAGFQEVDDPEIYRDIHHLRPLWWPGLPLVVELHNRPKWPDGLEAPPTEELLAAAVPGRLGVAGIDAPAPEHHTLIVAAHAWAHEPLGRLGHLVDVAVALQRSDPAEVAALARRWGCERMWRTTRAAVGTVLEDDGGSAALAVWARHVGAVRERTVFEWHVKGLLAPLWGLPPAGAVAAIAEELHGAVAPDGPEPWRVKLRRSWLAVNNAGVARSEHRLALDGHGATSMETQEAG
jgi:hypothetical protein